MRVLVADPLSSAGVDELAEDFEVAVRPGMSRSELIETIRDVDAVVVRSSTTLDAGVLAAGDRLKVVARAGIGLDNIDVDAATADGIIVCNAPRANVVSAAEHTVALLLALARDIPSAHTRLTDGRWERDGHQGVELHDKTLGVLGLGRVGQLVTQRLAAFGMRPHAYDPYLPPGRAAKLGVRLVDSVEALCRIADVLTVHLPRTPDTVGLIGARQLEQMKSTALLVNTARGGIVDEDALHAALVEGTIAGAALDVFDDEPATHSPLLELDNTVVTPHLGASTVEAQDKAGLAAAEVVRTALRGDLVPTAVNLPMNAAVPERVAAYLPLAERLGRLCAALSDEPVTQVHVEYRGTLATENTDALNLAVLRGMVADTCEAPVNLVNAPWIADDRGLELTATEHADAGDHVCLVRVTAGSLTVAGTLMGAAGRQRLVELWGAGLDIELSEHLLCLRYTDRPGVAGLVGGELGDADINVSSMQVTRDEQGDEALMVLGVESPVADDVLAALAIRVGATRADYVRLGATDGEPAPVGS